MCSILKNHYSRSAELYLESLRQQELVRVSGLVSCALRAPLMAVASPQSAIYTHTMEQLACDTESALPSESLQNLTT